MKSLQTKLEKLETYISLSDKSNPKVSKANVAWHLDHMLKTINTICDGLAESDPTDYKPNISALRTFCHTLNYIPRGRAQSPKYVLPPENIVVEDLQLQLKTAREKLKTLPALHEKANIIHPYFKRLNKAQSIRFIEVHTTHHLKIIRDILKGY